MAVINHNGAATLAATLRSVRAQRGVRLAGITVLDNASADGSLALLERDFPGVEVRRFPENRGPNPARNEGLRRAASDLVLVMDNDIELEPDYAAKLAAVLRAHPGAGAASGQIRVQGEPETVQYNGLEIHYAGEIAARSLAARDTVRVSCVSAGAALFDRRPVERVGGFDEDFFMGWEDGDLSFRLSLAGHPCYMVSAAAAYHARAPRGMKWIRFQTRNRWWFILKNYDRRTLWLAWPAIAGFQAAAGLFLILKGQGGAFLRGTAEAFAGWPALRAKRRAVQALKTVPDRDLLRGDRFDLPGGLAAGGAGRALNTVLNKIFYGYWLCIRPFLRSSP